jgi:hypothetical protein
VSLARCDIVVIGETAKNMHYRNMGRLRILAMVLSCLAVLAAGLPAIAFASAPAAIDTMRMVGVEPCQHCPDCDSGKCAPGAMTCVASCLASLPTLGVAPFTLPAIEASRVIWPSRLAALHGLSSPPDPFPPRS